MSDTISAIYERGVLRLLTPLLLPEQTRVQIQIVTSDAADDGERQRVRQVLLDAGVIHPRTWSEPGPPVSEAQLDAAARALAVAGPLSEEIIAERDER